jgi:hypothetical protein
MQILILSDIHGNVSALNSVLKDVEKRYKPDTTIILGDNIDYGMRSDEIIQILKKFPYPICCSIWGNHEKAIMEQDYTKFSSERGRKSAKFTRSKLSESSISYLNCELNKSGKMEIDIENKRILAVHGSIEEIFWKSIAPEGKHIGYENYDYVISGHSHRSHVFSEFYYDNNEIMRNEKKTVFLNPGSVGQPRNHNPRAQYAIWDTNNGIYLCEVEYEIQYEMSLYTDDIDMFYRERLKYGI